jgi:protoporphyrinogen oxidase
VAVEISTDWMGYTELNHRSAVLVTPDQRKSIVCITSERAKGRNVPAGKDLLQVFLYDGKAGTPTDSINTYSDAAISEITLRELGSIFPGFPTGVDSRAAQIVDIQRWNYSIPVFEPGKARAIQTYRSGRLKRSSRILLAGDGLGFPCTDGAAESGIWTANHILTH